MIRKMKRDDDWVIKEVQGVCLSELWILLYFGDRIPIF